MFAFESAETRLEYLPHHPTDYDSPSAPVTEEDRDTAFDPGMAQSTQRMTVKTGSLSGSSTNREAHSNLSTGAPLEIPTTAQVSINKDIGDVGDFKPPLSTLEPKPQTDSLMKAGDFNQVQAPSTWESSTLAHTKINLDVGETPAMYTKQPAGRKKKKRRNMKPGAPAVNTVRGFTPVPSGDEDSDYSTVSTSSRLTSGLKTVSSPNSSPFLRPSSSCSQGGISALKLQLDSLNLDGGTKRPPMNRFKTQLSSRVSSGVDSSPGSNSDGERTPMTTYEVPLEHDFINPELGQKPLVGAIEGGLVQDTVARKMTAADFHPLRCLGKGSYGTVLLVRHASSGRLYAQKQFRKASLTVHKKLVEQTKTERSILESVNRHPFVVKLYYAFQDHEKLYLILEYAQGGELFTHLANERMFTEETASFYMAEMVLALEHLHRNVGVVYRDLKPENCLLDSEGHLLLTDFGLSKVAVDEHDHCKSILGTIEYMAPEVVLGNNYGTAVDWWSLGALGYDLLTGSPPFPAGNHAKIQEKILKQKLNLPYFLGPDAKDLLTRLLRKEPHKRLGGKMPNDMQTIKKHRFFRKISWKALERRELDPPIRPLITDPELAENFAAQFTDLAVSPVATSTGINGINIHEDGGGEGNPFGGFSFVASSSLLECGDVGL
ncbi:MAG: serine/threonine protein kinase psk1 [Sclerophora amabilis]|nr:MAG: serine/threonine protein kinase psk1 [Sclerophora amabilis]